MQNISAFISKVGEAKSALSSGDYKKLWRCEIDLQDMAYNAVFGDGFGAAPGQVDPAQKAELKASCDDLKRECEKAQAHPPTGAGEVGKIGDGKILKLLLEILPVILALF